MKQWLVRRGVLATVPVAALVFAFGACSSETGTPAQRIADTCLLDGRVQWAQITVHKPDAPIDATFRDVALTITRNARPRHD